MEITYIHTYILYRASIEYEKAFVYINPPHPSTRAHQPWLHIRYINKHRQNSSCIIIHTRRCASMGGRQHLARPLPPLVFRAAAAAAAVAAAATALAWAPPPGGSGGSPRPVMMAAAGFGAGVRHPELSNAVTTEWLGRQVEEGVVGDGLVVVDIRGEVQKARAPGSDYFETVYKGCRDEYTSAHIPGAVFVDWTEVSFSQLAGRVAAPTCAFYPYFFVSVDVLRPELL